MMVQIEVQAVLSMISLVWIHLSPMTELQTTYSSVPHHSNVTHCPEHFIFMDVGTDVATLYISYSRTCFFIPIFLTSLARSIRRDLDPFFLNIIICNNRSNKEQTLEQNDDRLVIKKHKHTTWYNGTIYYKTRQTEPL